MTPWSKAALIAAAAGGLCVATLSSLPAEETATDRINIVVATGGHGFQQKPFLAMFKAMDGAGITFTHAPQKDHSELFEDISEWKYDVIVLYNMTQKISEKRRKHFMALLDKGVGVVVLHHALAAWQDWPDYANKIAGGKFYTKPTVENGVKREKSGWKEGLDYTVHIEDPNHPITRGMKDFKIHDETYCRYSVSPKAHLITTTDEPTSEKAIGWTLGCGKARTCFIINGHDGKAYANPGYRKLVTNAIRWAARKLN